MRLVFLDCETTGLAPEHDSLLEIAIIVVDAPRLAEVARWQSLVKPLPEHVAKADPAVKKMHTESGLWADLAATKAALRTATELEPELKVWLLNKTEGQRCYLAGSNPDFDRRFLRHHLPNLERQLHYRNWDVNSFFILREMIAGKEKTGTKHRAMADCEQAIQGVKDHLAWMASVYRRGWVPAA